MSLNLPHRVAIQTQTRIHFGGGAYTSTWNTESVVWANCQVLGVTNDEMYNKQQQFSKWKIRLKYTPSLSSKKRLIFETRILRIEGVHHIGNRGYKTEVICSEEVI